ncbi:MAG: purine-binding chemotaxis protein CheW [Sandaracinaceae bacterium]|nr:purine-binding chemotaxis protein CheW [Sandaracinaceae bacterium]
MVGSVQYAVSIFEVREIINPMPVVELPHAPAVVLGVTDHRGEVVPIIDLRLRFGLESSARTRRTKWVVVELDGRAVGLVVDAVTEVFGTTSADERAVPALGRGDDVRGIAQVFNHGGKLVFVIDVARVAAPARGLDVDAVAMAALSELPPPPSPLGGTPNAPAPQRGKSRRP